MALLTLVEAAIESGFGVELIERLLRDCPKSGEDRTLRAVDSEGVPHVDADELRDYLRYLREPWPLTEKGSRPHVPAYVANDVRAESHHGCAICGAMDNGELAHIDPSAKTYNNSPDNLLLLCPNHHTKYDLGYKPASNVTKEVVRAAKEMKRASRRRMLRYEGNVTAMLHALVRMIDQIEKKATIATEPLLQEAYKTQIQSLIKAIPQLALDAQKAAAEDRDFTEMEAAIIKIAPDLWKRSQVAGREQTEGGVRGTGRDLVRVAAPIFELDEVKCPRCHGRGQTGVVGDLCAYCGGSCYVSSAEAEEYDPDDIDEVKCPRCHGRGQTGVVGDLCAYCGGSCFVSREIADTYETEDETD
jgi:hypothetical protein